MTVTLATSLECSSVNLTIRCTDHVKCMTKRILLLLNFPFLVATTSNVIVLHFSTWHVCFHQSEQSERVILTSFSLQLHPSCQFAAISPSSLLPHLCLPNFQQWHTERHLLTSMWLNNCLCTFVPLAMNSSWKSTPRASSSDLRWTNDHKSKLPLWMAFWNLGFLLAHPRTNCRRIHFLSFWVIPIVIPFFFEHLQFFTTVVPSGNWTPLSVLLSHLV